RVSLHAIRAQPVSTICAIAVLVEKSTKYKISTVALVRRVGASKGGVLRIGAPPVPERGADGERAHRTKASFQSGFKRWLNCRERSSGLDHRPPPVRPAKGAREAIEKRRGRLGRT